MNIIIRKVGALWEVWEVQSLDGRLSMWKGCYKTEAGAKRQVKQLASRYDVTLVDENRHRKKHRGVDRRGSKRVAR